MHYSYSYFLVAYPRPRSQFVLCISLRWLILQLSTSSCSLFKFRTWKTNRTTFIIKPVISFLNVMSQLFIMKLYTEHATETTWRTFFIYMFWFASIHIRLLEIFDLIITNIKSSRHKIIVRQIWAESRKLWQRIKLRFELSTYSLVINE